MIGKSSTDKASALCRLGCGGLLLAFACLIGGVAKAQGPPPTLITAPPVYPGAINTIPNAVAMGDFNGDGLLDFAVVEYNPNSPGGGQIEIFLGNPDGSFTSKEIDALGMLTGQPNVNNHTIAVGHFNGPTQPLGIAVAVNQSAGCPSGGVVFFFGFGNGTFQSPTCLANPSAITSIAVADFNNDGFDDVAVSNVSGAAAGSITVYLNHAVINTGPVVNSFYNYASYSAVLPGLTGPTLYGTIVAGNINGQNGTSLALLASTGPFTQYVSVFENEMVEQSGGFFLDFVPPQLQLAAPPNGFSDIALADITGNGGAALVGIGTQGLQYSIITQQAGVGNPQLGAFNGVSRGPIGLALAVADFDGNGIPDLAYLDTNLNLNISLNPVATSSSNIGPFGPKGHGIAAGLSTGLNKWVVVDAGIDQPLNPFFAPYNAARSVAVYLVDPTTGKPEIAPLYAQSPLLTTFSNTITGAFAVADFNGVGVPDVAVLGQDEVNFDATVSIFQNAYKTATPPGYATPPTVIDLGTLLGLSPGSIGYGGSSGYALAAGSFRAFNPDLALVTSQGITLLENQGANAQGSFNFTLAPNCQGYFGGPATPPNNCYLGNDSNFPGLNSSSKIRPPILAADMNGDGIQDIVVAFPENCNAGGKSAIYVLLSNGDGTFQPPIYIPSPVVNPVGLAVGNLLGHGVLDLVVVNGGEICSGTEAVTGAPTFVGAAVIPNDGAGLSGAAMMPAIFAQTSDVAFPSVSAVAVADMNGDGLPDVVFSATDGLHVFLNNPQSPGVFADQGAVPLYGPVDIITNAAQIDIADLNKDGKLDVAAAIGGIVYIFPGDGKGGLSTPVQAFAAGPDSNQVRAIDVNGDGTADVVVNNSLGFSVLLNGSSVGSGNPIAEFLQTPLNFIPLAQGATDSMFFTLTNPGGAPLTLGSVAYANNTGNQFSTPQVQCGTTMNPGYPIVITPGAFCSFTITFAPTAIGPASAQLVFYNNASISNVATLPATGPGSFQQSISLTGAGTAGQANVSINAGIAPVPVIVGTLDTFYTIKLTNSGPDSATNLIFTHQLEPSVLYETSSNSQGSCTGQQALGALITCNIGTLPAGSSATILLQVDPTLAATLTNVFQITEDETDSNPESVHANVAVLSSLTVTIPTIMENISVSDTPTFPDIPVSEPITVSDRVFITPLLSNFAPPAAAFSNSSLGFAGTVGSVQALTLSSVGGAPLMLIGSPIISAGFTVSPPVCSSPLSGGLPTGGQCVYTITYTGGAAPSGTIVFTDNAALSNLTSTPVTGGYTQTIQLNAAGSDSAPLGLPSTTVNIGTITESITVSDTPAFPDIAVPENIAVSDLVFVTPLLSNFAPPAAAFSNSSLGFGNTLGSVQTLTLSSVGGAPLTLIGSPTISSGFTVSTPVCSSPLAGGLPTGGQCLYTITYTGGAASGSTIVFADNAALSNVTSTPVTGGYTQTILLNAAGSDSAPLSLPSATVNIPTINETIQVTDAPVVSNTEGGTNVTVTPVDTTTGSTPVTLKFTNVTQPGVTTLTTSPAGPPAPTGFQLGNPGVYYNLSTTAIYTGPVTICINYIGTTFTQAPQLFHYQNGVWTNVTTSVNTTNTVVCGTTTSFSPFALFQPSAFPTTTAISAAGVSYGTPGSVTVSVSSSSGTVTGNVSLSVDGGTASTMALSGGSASFILGVLSDGSHSLTASFVAQGNFLGSSAAGTLNVGQAPLTVTANGSSRQYGGVDSAFTVSYGGFVNGDGPGSLSGKLTCAAGDTASSPIGNYAINCSGLSSPNYAITFVPGTLTVTKAVLTITANNVTKTLNAANPTFGWTASGFVNGENASVFTATPTCTTTATTTSPVGSYPITCSGANAANYTFSYVPGTLKIVYAPNVGHVIQPPINADGTSVFKQGRTIPAQFSVYDANGVSIGTPGVVTSFFLTRIVSGTVTTAVDNVVDTNNPDTVFRWDPTGQQWVFNITTGNLSAGSTYIYTITLNDGSTIIFQYGLR